MNDKAEVLRHNAELKKRVAELEETIAEGKRMEEEARISEEKSRSEKDKLESILSAMSDGIYIVNQEYDIEYVNPALVADFGHCEGRKCYAYFHAREDVCPWCRNPDVFAGKTVRWEWTWPKNGKTYDLLDVPLRNADGSISKVAIFRDITERKQAEEFTELQTNRAKALLALPSAAEQLDELAFMQRGQELAEKLTDSSVCFIHFVNDNEETIELVTWSRRTLEHYCQAVHEKHYPVKEAGIWADALRRQRPVVFNNYPGYHRKHGLPEGHAELTRFISVPVIENGKVVMLTGVGNKDTNYTDMDVETVQLISNEIWNSVQRHRNLSALSEANRIVKRGPAVAFLWKNEKGWPVEFVSENVERLFGYPAHEFIERKISFSELIHSDDHERVREEVASYSKEGGLQTFKHEPYRIIAQNGDVKWIDDTTSIRRDSRGIITHYEGIVYDITERKQAEAALRDSKQKVERLHGISRRLEGCKSEEDVYRTTIEAAETVLDLSLASLDIVEGNMLVAKATSVAMPSDAKMESSLDEGGLAAKTYRTGTTTVFGRIEEVPEAKPPRETYQSGIIAPISDIGVFQVASTEKDVFRKEDVHLLELLLDHTGEAIKRIRLQKKLEEQAIRDPLTNVYNRRYFNQVIEQEFSRSKRYDHPIRFLMVDVDHFKKINDTYGHQIGDRILQRVAELLVEQVRETDIVVRYGGDEFLLVLMETDEQAETVKERILTAVEKRTQTNEIAPFPVRLSIGAAHWRPESKTPLEETLAEADRRMYETRKNRE